MVIGSTGFQTFADPREDLQGVLKNCRQAKLMLLDPCSEGATARAERILYAEVKVESFTQQIRQSNDPTNLTDTLEQPINLESMS